MVYSFFSVAFDGEIDVSGRVDFYSFSLERMSSEFALSRSELSFS